jgi:xanthine dehydrogenase accessory factor
LTYSHALDLALCDAILHHGFADLGLIGSKTKWARFKKRLGEMGHSALSIETINCPIGDPAFGKHPFEIAISVSHSLLKSQSTSGIKKERSA